MILFEEFENIVREITASLPEVFFRELNGGVIVREQEKKHPAAKDDDLFIVGEYQRNRYLGRSIMLYYGSFVRCYDYLETEVLYRKIRKVILHEFRHHLESLAGERELEIEDAVQIAEYNRRKGQTEDAFEINT